MLRFGSSGGFFAALVFAGSLVASLDASAQSVSVQVVDFETLVASEALFEIDVNNDGIDDVRFSTTDPGGFRTSGPNPDTQLHATGQMLETSSLTDPDIRVDFLGGATGQLQVGFVLGTEVGELDQGLLLEVFDQSGNQLGSKFHRGELLPISTGLGSDISMFPEGLLSVSFQGVASYALFDANGREPDL